MSQQRAEPDPNRWRVLPVCLAVGFITTLDVSIVNVALPSIESSLDAGPTQLQLVVAGYTLAFGLALVPAGRLGDAGARRPLFIAGLLGFALMSLASGLAPTDTWLGVARLLQGVSAGVLNPQVVGLIQQQFRGYERGRAFGMFGATIGVSTALGPLLGGLIIAAAGPETGWRWVFLVNIPVVAVLLPFAWRLVPGPPRTGSGAARGPRRLDLVGLGLLGAATLGVMMPFVTTTGRGDDASRWWWLVPAAAAVAAAVGWERRYQRRTGEAVLDPQVVGLGSFRNGALLGLAYFAGFTGIFLVVTLYLQDELGYTPLQAGLVGTPFAVASGVSAWFSGRWVARWGRELVVGGVVLVLVGVVAAEVVVRTLGDDPGAVGPALAVALLVAGAGSGTVIAPNQTLTLSEVPVSRAGVAGSMLQLGQRIGSAVGISVVLSVYYGGLASGDSAADATGRALLVTIGLVAVALVVGLLDLRSRRAEDRRTGRADA
ncbi:MFS transporter [Cellulosimicrobium sp. XJ-DQ-B-000]|uniref:MFS transporter n=1 Tax=Cellulosimicrobium TaxID=157920 RepID=UPI002041DD04|nr:MULTISPECIES: MFS transporter [Cellulosimicrobium]MCM3532803.1 MFS transporter [Cellulosimicrobium funkei]MDQ8041625.1 MFS transporter [Cellulosimicrobium sp. XJ-DQ-B-000]